MMNISPINPAAPYAGSSDSIDVQKNEKAPTTETSLFRAWARGSEKVLASDSVQGILSSPQSSEAFWNQWPEKKWKVG